MSPSDLSSAVNSPTVSAVHHVSLRVDDLDKSLDFYVRLLGCERLERPDLGFRGAWLAAGDVQVHLLEFAADDSTGAVPPRATPMANHVAFAVADASEFRRHVERNGFVTTTVPQASPNQFWMQDPSGNIVEFIVG